MTERKTLTNVERMILARLASATRDGDSIRIMYDVARPLVRRGFLQKKTIDNSYTLTVEGRRIGRSLLPPLADGWDNTAKVVMPNG